MENFQTLNNPLLNLSVRELEQMAYVFYGADCPSNNYKLLIRNCMWRRKIKLNDGFVFTQEAIERLRFINDLLQQKQERILSKCVSLSFDFLRERESEKGLPYDVIIEGEINHEFTHDHRGLFGSQRI